MEETKKRSSLAKVFTLINLFIFVLLSILAFITPMGFASSSHQKIAIIFIVITSLTPLSVPFGIYMGWKNLKNPSTAIFLFYHLLPLISLGLVYTLCFISTELLN